MAIADLDIPDELRQALQGGFITSEQILQVIEIWSKSIGLSSEDAIRLGEAGQLPQTHVGADLDAFVFMYLHG